MRARELASGASSSRPEDVERSTSCGAEIIVVSTERVPTTEVAGSRKSYPPAC